MEGCPLEQTQAIFDTFGTGEVPFVERPRTKVLQLVTVLLYAMDTVSVFID
jgi:hypothetical protein